MLREAIATGDEATRELAETALSQILHQEVADVAIQDGEGIDPDECPAVLEAADEAYHASNWDLAQSSYQALYGGRRVPDNYRYAGALGLGRCEAYRGNYDVGASCSQPWLTSTRPSSSSTNSRACDAELAQEHWWFALLRQRERTAHPSLSTDARWLVGVAIRRWGCGRRGVPG